MPRLLTTVERTVVLPNHGIALFPGIVPCGEERFHIGSVVTLRRPDGGPTYTSPTGAGATIIDGVEYEYVASAEREKQIVSGFPKLKVGQSREEVRDALGMPDTARPGYSKEYNSRFLGWSYMYKIK